MGEPGLSHAPDGLDAPGYARSHWRLELFGRARAMGFQDLWNRVRRIESMSVRMVAERFDLFNAQDALAQQIIFEGQSEAPPW